ncbi:hypothetical protein DSO57_1007222 [Entomophthora muscae]|uniref:Uncharacterized protein n=1 Tax=Entomophthora muscae TaxID=34485 RepID=A0ACC2TI72_9FUNG|nr:hypothetical protein DSO57_1007222 [Entomophthora muscae]
MLVDPSDMQNGVVTYEKALACLDSFPLTEAIRGGTLATLRQTLEFSANEGAAAMKAELDRIATTAYVSERQFHMDITHSYLSMHDVDFAYTSACTTSFRFQQPLMMRVIMGQDGETRVVALKTKSIPPKAGAMWRHLDLDQLNYSDVLSIDGKPPLEYLQAFADMFAGASKDPGVRLSMVLADKKLVNGEFSIFPGLFSESPFPPKRPAIEFELLLRSNLTQKLSIPYAVHVPPVVKDSQSMYAALCSNPSPNPNPNHHTRSLVRREVMYDGVYTKLYRVGTAGASLYVGTLSPDNKQRWYEEIQRSVAVIKAEKRKSLIVDVSNIKKGDICLAVHLAEFFSFAPLPPLELKWNPNARQLPLVHMPHQDMLECPPTTFKSTPALDISLSTNGVCLSTCQLFMALLDPNKTHIISGPYPTTITAGKIGAPIELKYFTTLLTHSTPHPHSR